MDFRERGIDFQEADRRYAELARQRDAGSISDEEFDAQRRRLMVQDDEGRWWAKSRKTGEWNYRDGDTWVRGTPPGYQEVVPKPTTDSSSKRTPSPPHPRGVENGKDERQRGLPWVPVAIGLVGLVALVGIGIIFWVLAPYLWSDDDDAVPAVATVALPDVVGMSQDEAEENLRDTGFEAETKTQESSEEDKGVVMEQSPSAGAEAEENSTVAITVGEGRPAAAPGYVLVENDSGNLSMEVPSGWSEHSTGEDGTLEGADVDAGEGVGPAITASTDIETFESTGEVPGVYVLASRSLAREYDEDQLATSGFNERTNCDVVAREDFDRGSYSGKLVSWNCSTNGSTPYTLAAAPEDRECVVMLQITVYSEADRESAKHILDTFEIDCGRIV
jgi:PASTA domain